MPVQDMCRRQRRGCIWQLPRRAAATTFVS
jgi:hypothetical protein